MFYLRITNRIGQTTPYRSQGLLIPSYIDDGINRGESLTQRKVPRDELGILGAGCRVPNRCPQCLSVCLTVLKWYPDPRPFLLGLSEVDFIRHFCFYPRFYPIIRWRKPGWERFVCRPIATDPSSRSQVPFNMKYLSSHFKCAPVSAQSSWLKH